jgi:hypothetical protein
MTAQRTRANEGGPAKPVQCSTREWPAVTAVSLAIRVWFTVGGLGMAWPLHEVLLLLADLLPQLTSRSSDTSP